MLDDSARNGEFVKRRLTTRRGFRNQALEDGVDDIAVP